MLTPPRSDAWEGVSSCGRTLLDELQPVSGELVEAPGGQSAPVGGPTFDPEDRDATLRISQDRHLLGPLHTGEELVDSALHHLGLRHSGEPAFTETFRLGRQTSVVLCVPDHLFDDGDCQGAGGSPEQHGQEDEQARHLPRVLDSEHEEVDDEDDRHCQQATEDPRIHEFLPAGSAERT